MKNGNRTMELLSIVFFSLLLLAVFVFFVLVPEGKEYRNLGLQIQEIDAEVSKLQMRYDSCYDRHRKLQEERQAVIEALESSFDEKIFIEMLGRNVTAVDLDMRRQIDEERGIYIQKAGIKARFRSPENFYRLVDGINGSGWVVSIEKPITFERIGDEINASFSIKVYHSLL